MYGAVDLRFDGDWDSVHVGLGARGVWLDGEFRRADWSAWQDAVRVVRWIEVVRPHAALAIGGLAPAQLEHVADGYRATLDDRRRTGVRVAATSDALAAVVEIDDVIEPGLIGGSLEAQLAPRVVGFAATAIDPDVAQAAIELAAARRWTGERSRVDLGGGAVAEPGLGVAALAFVSGAIERAGARWWTTGDVRAGSGSVGAAFGALQRIERATIYERSRRGVGGAIAVGVTSRLGWLHVGVRARPELGRLATVMFGAPMGRWVQAGGWLASSSSATAGAAEVRVAWAKRLASTLELARMYETGTMATQATWSATVWFVATSD